MDLNDVRSPVEGVEPELGEAAEDPPQSVPESVRRILSRTGEVPEAWFEHQREARATATFLGTLYSHTLSSYLLSADDNKSAQEIAESAFSSLILPRMKDADTIDTEQRARAIAELANLHRELSLILKQAHVLHRVVRHDSVEDIPFSAQVNSLKRLRAEYAWAEQHFIPHVETAQTHLETILGRREGDHKYLTLQRMAR